MLFALAPRRETRRSCYVNRMRSHLGCDHGCDCAACGAVRKSVQSDEGRLSGNLQSGCAAARRWEVGPRRRGLEVIVESLFIHQPSANGRAVLLSLLADARLRTTLPNRGIEVASLRIFLQALILLTRSARSSIRHARAQAYVRLTDERET